ncbi:MULTISPECIES: LURP-one-related/scramblase family protein [unclassified Colwellia]|jgi:uncharacterized protein YxjI|uniref:LURP-one-related/scramblase family protein n=1 Tax=unclassified Colwellia TaxID=196834 RepID=UPI0015F51B57|nr:MULTISPECIES: phospholipid scramblase-related protein [unclassified Colwellia]MBA6353217.1 RNAase [Colwellia sp. BRX9-1]MBA6355868.1 RNAase [Colwellia sp. BRX8-3]MBA6359529.1 RNAase [Colwellia sp. BRX8-6]MBA6367410.1 RNAase [Colwellia sp. BRX8-5]MBA6371330.1 RNAase [Colwellia sp. BRX8-4]
MNTRINKNTYIIKEHVGLFKAANNYDIYDPETGDIIMECREPNLGFFTKMLRFTDYKTMTPFDVQIRTPDDQRIIRIQRGISLFISKVTVFDCDGNAVGYFKQKLFSIGGKFDIFDNQDQLVCQLKGNWVGWNFRFMDGNDELAHISKEWGGIGKELFTSADNYALEISADVPEDHPIRKLILAAVMCIDMVLKE